MFGDCYRGEPLETIYGTGEDVRPMYNTGETKTQKKWRDISCIVTNMYIFKVENKKVVNICTFLS